MILLDTHVLVWLTQGSSEMGRSAQDTATRALADELLQPVARFLDRPGGMALRHIDLVHQLLLAALRIGLQKVDEIVAIFALRVDHQRLGRAAREPAGFSLAIVDLDDFKRINDTHGHLVGDRVIRFVASTLRRLIKGKDTAARFGGEELAVVLPDTPASGAMALAENIRRAIADARLVRSDTREPLSQITVSIGVGSYRRGEEVNTLFDRTDQALYAAKSGGRNRVVNENAAGDAIEIAAG